MRGGGCYTGLVGFIVYTDFPAFIGCAGLVGFRAMGVCRAHWVNRVYRVQVICKGPGIYIYIYICCLTNARG